MRRTSHDGADSHGIENRSSSARALLATLLSLSVVACTGGEDGAPSASTQQRALPPTTAEADWSRGKDPAMVERVEFLVSQLDLYRANLASLGELGYRPSMWGIWTGMVIVCGHVVPPPYEIEADLENDLVRLNGIELTSENSFNISGECRAKISSLYARRERERYLARKRERESRPGMALRCAKRKEIQRHGHEYFKRRIDELGVVVDEETGQPDDWDKVFRACQDTRDELERVFGAYIARIRLPESRTGRMLFSMKDSSDQTICDGGAVLDLNRKFRDKLRWKKMHIRSEKELAEYEARHKWVLGEIDESVTYEAASISEKLRDGVIVLLGIEYPRFKAYDQPAKTAAIRSLFDQAVDPERAIAGLLDARIGSSLETNNKQRQYLNKNVAHRENEELIMLVLAAQELAVSR